MRPNLGSITWSLGALFLIALAFFAFLGPKSPVVTAPEPQTRPQKPQVSDKVDIFGKNGNAVEGERILDSIVQPFAPITDIFTNPTKNIGSPSVGTKRQLSQAEIFNILFPDHYIQSLLRIQDSFIGFGWMKLESKRVLDTEENLFAFLNDIVEVMASRNFYLQDQAKMARDALHIYYPRVVAQKKAELQNQTSSLLDSFNFAKASRGAANSSSLNYLATFIPLLPSVAEAEGAGQNIPGIWETSPTCFKGLQPQATNKGSDLYSFCCNCGCKIEGYTCNYKPDCGPYAGQQGNTAECDVHLGCLNSSCDGQYNAIWDGNDGITTQNFGTLTNKCGCDNPQKTQQGGGGN